jgi:hypothetical protein
MAGLPNNTFAAPGVSFYATAGGGAASTLQSPVAVIPDVNGSTEVVAQATGNGDASLQALVYGGGFGTASILVGGGGPIYSMSVTANPGNDVLAIGVNGATTAAIFYDGTTGDIEIGDRGAGTIRMNNATAFYDTSIDPTEANGVYIAPTSASSAVIENTIASSGTLSLGSSTNINQLVLSDTGAGTGKVSVGGNGGASVVITGSGAGNNRVSVGTNAASNGVMSIGSSTAFPNTIVVSDQAYLGAGNYVEVFGAAGQAPLFISGSQGPANQCGIHPDAGVGTAQLLLGSDNTNNALITLNGSNTTIAGATATVNADTTFNGGNLFVKTVLSFGGGAFNSGGVGVGAIEAFNTYTSSVISGSNTVVPIPQPTATGTGAAMEVGLYLILTNGTIGGTVSPTAAVSTIAYWNGSAWSFGGGGCCPALVSSPPSYFGIQATGATMSIANGSGLGAAAVNVVFIQLGGSLGL